MQVSVLVAEVYAEVQILISRVIYVFLFKVPFGSSFSRLFAFLA